MEEILHQLIGSLSHYLQGFIHLNWCRISSINSMTLLITIQGPSCGWWSFQDLDVTYVMASHEMMPVTG